jgi:hypothetical protein
MGPAANTALVIGGTGMLAQATRWLVARSAMTLLVARCASRFAAGGGRVVPLDADWSDSGFRAAVERALGAAPPIHRALLWLHEPEPILPWLLPLLPDARVVLVLGLSHGQPALPRTAARIATVRLGSMPVEHGRRWLSHEEISAGAIAALQEGMSRTVGAPVPVP